MNRKKELETYGYISEDEMKLKCKSFPYYSMREVAKKTNKIGQNNLYKLLRELKYLDENNVAYEEFVDQDFFVNRSTPRRNSGVNYRTNQVFVSYKGLELIKTLVSNI